MYHNRAPLSTEPYRHVVFPHASSSAALVNYASCACEDETSTGELSAEDAFILWLFHQAKLNRSNYKRETLRRRVPSCLRALRVGSVDEARVAVQRNAMNLETAVSAVVLGVSSFFRDPPVFDFLRDQVLARRISTGNEIRIWSAGCSDGQELYSVAMVLDEMGALRRSTLCGTDCRRDAVARSAAGVFDCDAVASLPISQRERYFLREGRHVRIKQRLRDAVRWHCADVLRGVEPGEWDVILCRNLAIYLSASAVGRLWRSLEMALRPGGVLVVGKAERPIGASRLSALAPGFYRRGPL